MNEKPANGDGNSAMGVLELLVGTRGMARMLNVSQRHIERLDASQLIPKPVWIGRAKRWRLSDIQEWLDRDCPDRATLEAQQRSES